MLGKNRMPIQETWLLPVCDYWIQKKQQAVACASKHFPWSIHMYKTILIFQIQNRSVLNGWKIRDSMSLPTR